MGRDLSCPSGLKAYKTKRDAERDAPPGAVVDFCWRCQWHHWRVKGRRRRERAEARAKRSKRR